MSADLPPNVDKQPVSTGSAYVYVFRPGNDGPPLVEPPVMFIREGKDPTLLAVMDNGRFIKVELESGEYRFFSDHLDKAPVNLILEADGAYYLEMNTAGNPFSRHVGTGGIAPRDRGTSFKRDAGSTATWHKICKGSTSNRTLTSLTQIKEMSAERESGSNNFESQ